MAVILGRVAELWRYPVKSLRGEQLDEVSCTKRGLDRDRQWAVRGADGKLGSGKTTRRFRRMPGLLSMSSHLDGDLAWIRFPDGRLGRVDHPSSAALVGGIVGEEVTLVEEATATAGEIASVGATIAHFDDASLHLLSTASLRWLQARHLGAAGAVDRSRFRPNVVIETGGAQLSEEEWRGARLLLGSALVSVGKRTERCVMTTLAQGELEFDPGILGTLHRLNDSCLGVYARVVQEGTIRVGDDVELRPAEHSLNVAGACPAATGTVHVRGDRP